jgi:GNAT superfamily N-acetyltransferase
MTFSVELWDCDTAQERAAQVFGVYDGVFGDTPNEASWRSGSFDPHCARNGFRLAACLVDGSDPAGAGLAGFAYGYIGDRGQWWPDQVVQALPAEVSDVWVGGHFEFVELAVLAPHRRQGIGARLHDVLLRGTEDRRALLGTDDADTPAVLLYRSKRWRKLGNLTPQTAVMGRWIGSRA